MMTTEPCYDCDGDDEECLTCYGTGRLEKDNYDESEPDYRMQDED